jgi:hypothetical protein
MGVDHVKKVNASKCGVDIQAEVDNGDQPNRALNTVIIKACFIQPNNELDGRMLVSETK